jgi:hypothetical protein
MLNRLFLFGILALLFSSCEDSMFLRSEKKIKSELQGTWERQFQGDTAIHHREYWIFNGDKLYTTFEEHNPPDLLDNGAIDLSLTDNNDTVIISGFKIDAKVFKAFIKFQLQQGDTTRFVDKWDIVELEKKTLYMAADDPTGNSVLQLEFARVK